MKKIMNWMLAAIFICGASVFTACSESEDNPTPKPTEKNRKEFIAHTRANLKTMAENMNFLSWNAANDINQKFNTGVLNNPEFEKAIMPLFMQTLLKNVLPVEEGSELAKMGYASCATIDLSEFNYRFTMKDDNSGFDVEPADDFEMILNSINPKTNQFEKGLYKLSLKAGGSTFNILLKKMSSGELAVVAKIPTEFNFAIASKVSGNWNDDFTGSFKNEVQLDGTSGFTNRMTDAFNISGIIKSSIPGSASLKSDATDLVFSVGQDPTTHKGSMKFNFIHNNKSMVAFDINMTNKDGKTDLSQLTNSNTLIDLFSAVFSGNSMEESTITLLDDLVTTCSISDCQKAIQIANEMAQARRSYADQQTIDSYTQQLNKLITASMTCKYNGLTIPMQMQTVKFGVDFTAMPALNFGDETGFVPVNQLLDTESMEYAINIIDHAVEPMQNAIIVVRQLLNFVQTYIAPNQREQADSKEMVQKLIGKWVATAIDGKPALTDDMQVLTFLNPRVAYISGSNPAFDPELSNMWTDHLECSVEFYDDKFTITSQPNKNVTLIIEMNIESMSDTEMVTTNKLTVKHDDEVIATKERETVRWAKSTEDYTEQILGMWEAINLDEQSELKGECRWVFLADGTFRFFQKVDKDWQLADVAFSDYIVDANMLCTRWKTNGESAQEHRDWWEIDSIEDGIMTWVAFSHKEDGSISSSSIQLKKVSVAESMVGVWKNEEIASGYSPNTNQPFDKIVSTYIITPDGFGLYDEYFVKDEEVVDKSVDRHINGQFAYNEVEGGLLCAFSMTDQGLLMFEKGKIIDMFDESKHYVYTRCSAEEAQMIRRSGLFGMWRNIYEVSGKTPGKQLQFDKLIEGYYFDPDGTGFFENLFFNGELLVEKEYDRNTNGKFTYEWTSDTEITCKSAADGDTWKVTYERGVFTDLEIPENPVVYNKVSFAERVKIMSKE